VFQCTTDVIAVIGCKTKLVVVSLKRRHVVLPPISSVNTAGQSVAARKCCCASPKTGEIRRPKLNIIGMTQCY